MKANGAKMLCHRIEKLNHTNTNLPCPGQYTVFWLPPIEPKTNTSILFTSR